MRPCLRAHLSSPLGAPPPGHRSATYYKDTDSPRLKGQPPTYKLPRQSTETNSFRCLSTWKSRWSSNKPARLLSGAGDSRSWEYHPWTWGIEEAQRKTPDSNRCSPEHRNTHAVGKRVWSQKRGITRSSEPFTGYTASFLGCEFEFFLCVHILV